MKIYKTNREDAHQTAEEMSERYIVEISYDGEIWTLTLTHI